MNTQFIRGKKLFTLAAVSLLLTAAPGLSATPTERSCGFVNSFQKGKAGATNALRGIFHYLDDQTLKSIDALISGLPEKFEDGQVAEIGNIGNLYVEHFIVLNSSEAGSVYFRIVYEKVEDDFVSVKFTVNSKVENSLSEWPVLQEPTPLKC